MVIFIALFCVMVYTDLRYYKIPNLCIAAGVAAGLVVTYMSCSASGVLWACVSAAAVFAAFYPFYLMGGLGAGDVKLLMTVCFFVSGTRIIYYLLVTFALAALISIVKIALFAESRQRLCYLGGYIKKAVLTGAVDDFKVDKAGKKSVIRLSVPAFISYLIMCAGLY